MATPVCPHCGQSIRSAKGCACRAGKAGVAPLRVLPRSEDTPSVNPQPEAKWELPALEAGIERRFRQIDEGDEA